MKVHKIYPEKYIKVIFIIIRDINNLMYKNRGIKSLWWTFQQNFLYPFLHSFINFFSKIFNRVSGTG